MQRLVGLVTSCKLCRGLDAELFYVCARPHHVALGLVLHYIHGGIARASVPPGRGARAGKVWGFLGGVLPEGPLATGAGHLVRS